ncbi:MAG: hypothetical protein Q7K57_42990 [Burkholderiaceae bacterium]|nr:hypothetical protein [Burkholderiaceae bacterium]MDO9260049.1 hypothetical protein [Polaromonas sp.]
MTTKGIPRVTWISMATATPLCRNSQVPIILMKGMFPGIWTLKATVIKPHSRKNSAMSAGDFVGMAIRRLRRQIDVPSRAFRDGVWWRSLTPSQQLTYVLGYMDSVAVIERATLASTAIRLEFASLGHVTAAQLAGEVDSFFYSKSRRRVSLSSAIYYASRMLSDPSSDHSELLKKLTQQ